MESLLDTWPNVAREAILVALRTRRTLTAICMRTTLAFPDLLILDAKRQALQEPFLFVPSLASSFLRLVTNATGNGVPDI